MNGPRREDFKLQCSTIATFSSLFIAVVFFLTNLNHFNLISSILVKKRIASKCKYVYLTAEMKTNSMDNRPLVVRA